MSEVPLLGSWQGYALSEDVPLISQKVFIKSFCKRSFPQKSVNLSFIITNVENKLTDLCGN